MSATTQRDTQMSLRMSREAKNRVERAAAVSGQSVSGFAAATLARRADDVLGRHRTITLGQAERDFFFALLGVEQEPSEKTKEAVRRYNALSREGAEDESRDRDPWQKMPRVCVSRDAVQFERPPEVTPVLLSCPRAVIWMAPLLDHLRFAPLPKPPPFPKLSSAARLRPLGGLVALGAALLLAAGMVRLHPPAPSARTLAAYATDLSQRTPHQRFNARRAAAALDGVTIAPGKTFSFNRAVRGWSADQGFLRAPVSYDGVLVDDYGGGVCETSTTVYNAALRAGLPILERHAHTFAPGYAPPGRDAAVAYAGVDLRFRNPYPQTLTLRVRPEGHRMVCRIEASRPLGGDGSRVAVRSETLDRFAAAPAPVRPGAGARRSRWHPLGRDGVRVAVYRDFYEGNRCVRRESVSDDTYRPISRAEWTMP